MNAIIVAADEAPALHPKLVALHSLWSDKRAGRPLPARDEIDVLDLAPWLGNLMLLHVEDGGRDFLYRVYGTTIAEYFGRDLTGRRISSLAPDVQRVVRAEYGEAISGVRPYVVSRRRSVNSARVRMAKLILPLGPSADRVDHLLVGVYLDE